MLAKVIAVACVGAAAAFAPGQLPVSGVASTSSAVTMMARGGGNNPKPLSPGSNYPSTKNIQTQKSGFGNFLQKFQVASSTKKSKYGMPVFLPNGNVNPAYLAAERADMKKQSDTNRKTAEAKRKGLIAAKKFELADFIRKKVGPVGSGKEYYESGR